MACRPRKQASNRKARNMKTNLERMLFGNACIMLATIFWGVNYAFTKALIPVWMTASDVSIVRLVGGCILFWIASLFMRPERLDKAAMWRAFFGGAIGLFSCIYLFVLALSYGSAIDISIIMTLPPVFVILMEVIFMRRRPSLLEYAGIVVSFIGAALVIMRHSSAHEAAANYLLGDFLAFAASFGFAFYLVILSKPTSQYKPISLLRWVFLYASLPVLIFTPSLMRMPLLECREAVPWLEIGFILFCPTFLAYLLTQPAIRAIGSVLVSLYQYLTPVVAAISAILMGVDKLRWMQVLAMLVIVAGMIMTNIGKKKETHAH